MIVAYFTQDGISYPYLILHPELFYPWNNGLSFKTRCKILYHFFFILIEYLSMSHRLFKHFVQLQRFAKMVQQRQLRPTLPKMRRSEELCQWKRRNGMQYPHPFVHREGKRNRYNSSSFSPLYNPPILIKIPINFY